MSNCDCINCDDLSRLEAMVDDDGGTWDLSDRDKAALSAAVKAISAVGELLEACEAVLRHFEGHGVDPIKLREMARAAIAKAKGDGR